MIHNSGSLRWAITALTNLSGWREANNFTNVAVRGKRIPNPKPKIVYHQTAFLEDFAF